MTPPTNHSLSNLAMVADLVKPDDSFAIAVDPIPAWEKPGIVRQISISDSITDVQVEDSDPDDISDVSMDEGILHPADCSLSSVESHVDSLHSDSSPRIIFGGVTAMPRTSHLNNTAVPPRHIATSKAPFVDFVDESRWTSYQEIQELQVTKTPLTSYEQAIQYYEFGLTTMPRSVSLKDPACSSPPPLLFIQSPVFRKRSLSESSSHIQPRRCIFNPPRDRSDSYSSAPPTIASLQSYQYSKTSLGICGGSSMGSKRKLKSCIKNKSDGDLSTVKGRMISPSTSNEKDLSVSFDPQVSIYDFNVPSVKWTQPGWSNLFA
jgi:hypothetical protein